MPRDGWILPARRDVSQRKPDQFGRRLVIWEVPLVSNALADLTVQAFDRVGGVEDFADLHREHEEGDHRCPIPAPRLRNSWIFLTPRSDIKRLEFAAGGVRILGTVDGLECRSHRFALFPRRKLQRVANQMHDAGLNDGVGIDGGDCLRECWRRPRIEPRCRRHNEPAIKAETLAPARRLSPPRWCTEGAADTSEMAQFDVGDNTNERQ